MKYILAISSNNVIGIGDRLPWRLPMDLKWFKMNTYGQTIIMGRRTFECIPKLKGRTYHVARRGESLPDGIVIGGATLVQSILKSGDIMYITHVLTRIEHSDAVYIKLKAKRLLWKTKTFSQNGLSFYFAAYQIL